MANQGQTSDESVEAAKASGALALCRQLPIQHPCHKCLLHWPGGKEQPAVIVATLRRSGQQPGLRVGFCQVGTNRRCLGHYPVTLGCMVDQRRHLAERIGGKKGGGLLPPADRDHSEIGPDLVQRPAGD